MNLYRTPQKIALKMSYKSTDVQLKNTVLSAF